MTRTTLDLDASVLRELRRRGEQQRKSMGAVASELLSQALARTEERPEPMELPWVSADLGAPHVDLDDKDALFRALDGHP